MTHRLRDERGSVSIWVLFWAIGLLFIAGFGLDLWRGVSVRRALSDQANAAAAAGANGIDEAHFRATGEVIIDPDLAVTLASDNLTQHGDRELVDSAIVTVDPLTQRVSVELTSDVDFTLINIFLAGEPPITVGATAAAAPRIGNA